MSEEETKEIEEEEIEETSEDTEEKPQDELSEEQLEKAKEALIAKGVVVDYETRFKPIYGSLKHTERELEGLKRNPPPETRSDLNVGAKPKRSDFDDDEEYLDARDEWIEKRTEVRLQEKAEKDQQSISQSKLDGQVASAIAKDPEFLDKGYIPVPLENILSDTDYLADFAYYFAENPADANRLGRLAEQGNIGKVSREIGRMEAKFESKPPPKKTTTNAPNPTAQTTGGKTTTSKPLEDMSMEEYAEKWRAKNL